MKTLLALDLENTIIPHWSQMDTYINMDKLDSIIEKYKPEEMTIFSYAVWSSENYHQLRSSQLMKDLIAKHNNFVGIEMTTAMAVDWMKLHHHKHLEVNATTVWQLPKEFSFLMFVRNDIEAGSEFDTYILFDDTAPHELVYTIGDGVQVIFLNPLNM